MFQTKVQIIPADINISYEDSIMTLGSCFAENIGRKMQHVYFKTEINPFGVLYNPISIRNSIQLLLENKPFTRNDIFEHHFLWQSFTYSSLFSDITPEKYLTNINNHFDNAVCFFQNINFLLITFGTAWVYEEKKNGSVVSNCHKLPASEFIRRRLTVEEIVCEYKIVIQKLQSLFPNLHIIFSVSPIRHWKDGAHENNISKSTLLIAIEELRSQFQKIHYFPAYEIQLDELRDYRFYASDMQHPSDVAIEYIWKRFSEAYFTDLTLQTCKKLEQYTNDLAHRPLHPESKEYIVFLNQIKERKEKILSEYPFLSDRIK